MIEQDYDTLSSDLGMSEGGINRLQSSEPIVLDISLREITKDDYMRQLGGDGCIFLQSMREGG